MATEERKHFNLNYWLNSGIGREKLQLENGEMITPYLHLNLVRKINDVSNIAKPALYTREEFLALLAEGRLELCQKLLLECEACRGTGAQGQEGFEEVCNICAGHGKTVTPFALEVLELLSFVNSAEPKVDEETLEKQNRLYHLKEKVTRAKGRAAEAKGYSLAHEMQQAEWAARQKVMDEQKKAIKQAEAKLAAEIKEVEALEKELSEK